MAENKKKISEIESELYALCNSITNLYKKYQEGTINDNFFLKALRNARNGLLKINIYFKEKNISLPKVLNDMNFTKEYNNAIRTIDNIFIMNPHEEKYGIPNNNHPNFSKTIKSSLLELPGITSEITSSFITLMDALKLNGISSSELITTLFDELKQNLNNFPGLEDIKLKIKKLRNYVLNNINNLIENKIFREKVEDHLYRVFNVFKSKINLKIAEK